MDFEITKPLIKEIISLCKKHVGKHPKGRKLPKIKLLKKKYEFIGEYCYDKNEIILYTKNINTKSVFIRVLIHEYTHFIQMYNFKTKTQYFKSTKQIGYENNPYEIVANLNAGWYWKRIFAKVKHLF